MKIELTNDDLREQFSRRIIHVDMDAFFASVEQRDKPELKGRPVIVGGKPNSRGVVAACSYEARRFGVHSAMPCSHAARLCPNAVYIRPDIQKYRQVSEQIHRIFSRYTSYIEPLSLDEAYLDVSTAEQPATEIAKAIKHDIQSELNLVASAGVSYNKFLAKLASDMDKPDGLFVIRPREAQRFVDALPVRKFHGIGPATEKKMQRLGVHTGRDLRRVAFSVLVEHFGRQAAYYYHIARAQDTRPVRTVRQRKSIGREATFSEDISDREDIERQLFDLAFSVAQTLNAKSLSAFTLTLKFKFTDFKQITRSYTAKTPLELSNEAKLKAYLRYLVDQASLGNRSVRLLGVSCSKLVSRHKMLPKSEYTNQVGTHFHQFELIDT